MTISGLKFNEQGLIPVIVQDSVSLQVLMLAYMNSESLQITLETKRCTYYSRSRNKLWVKGETSGHFQYVQKILYDCDADALLISIRQEGVACHTGEMSCFYREVEIG